MKFNWPKISAAAVRASAFGSARPFRALADAIVDRAGRARAEPGCKGGVRFSGRASCAGWLASRASIDAIKDFYGIREHRLETLLKADAS